MKQIHKNNHYVPQLYLKQWATNEEIPTYRLLVPNENVPYWKNNSLRGIGLHKHLYTYWADQEETDEIERWFGQEFETPAQNSINLAINDSRMTKDDWIRLIRFTIAQDVRTPSNLNAFLARQRDSLQELLNDTLEDSIRSLTIVTQSGQRLPTQEPKSSNFPSKVSITKNPDGDNAIKAEIIVGRKLWLWNVRSLLTNTIKKISHDHWTIVHAPEGIEWPTTDNPVVKLNFYNANNYNFNGGWGVHKCDIFMPLSPKHLLIKTVGERSFQRSSILDNRTATLIRKIIIEHADRYVFEKNPSDLHLVRPRLVSLEKYTNEQEAWKNWHRDQSDAEMNL